MDPQLIEAANAVADGTTVDWEELESRAMAPRDRLVISQLRVLEQIAQVHTNLPLGRSMAVYESLLDPSLRRRDSADIPATWGPLAILEKIGSGTFGDVYRARDPRLDRPVALKLLRQSRGDDPLDAAVVEEGRLMARVRHPNVVTVYGAERIDGRVGLWMEFVEGRTLGQEQHERGNFTADEITGVGLDLARALGAVHRAGLLHRDLNAQNVMRDRDGRILLTDFGAGREVLADDGSVRSDLAGTPLYLAPEVLAGHAATPQSDVYSLGVVLYHIATGSFPVRGQSLRGLREAHARGQRIPLRTVRPDLPDAVARVVERALRPDPSQRYQDADDLAQALLPLRPDSRAHRRNRFKVAAAAAAAVLVAVGGIGWGIGFRPGHQTRGAAGPGAQGMVLRELSPEVSLVGGAPSHDGRYVSRPDPETGALVLHEIATGTSVQLATHPKDKWEYANIGQSRFSPDDSQIAYGWVVDGRQELRIIGTSSDVTRPGARCTTTSRPV